MTNWPAEGTEWWQENVGHITAGHFGKTCKPVVDRRGWDATFAGLREWVEERKRLNRDISLAWFVRDSARWIEQAAMPLTDSRGDLTERGKRLVGIP